MSEHPSSHASNSPAVPEGHDGRFGDRFDDEIGTRGVLVTTFILGGLCLLAMVLMWGMKHWVIGDIQAAQPPISPLIDPTLAQRPITERQPQGVPNLQASPEAELIEMRREQAAQLHGWGWVDQGAGIVRVPIEVAMERVLAQGLSSRPAQAPAQEAAGEELKPE